MRGTRDLSQMDPRDVLPYALRDCNVSISRRVAQWDKLAKVVS